MSKATQQCRSLLGLFAERAAPRLYDSIVEVLWVRPYSRRTEEAYVHWIRRYIEFHRHRHPRQLAEGDVNRFLTHLAVPDRGTGPTSHRRIAVSAVAEGRRAPIAPHQASHQPRVPTFVATHLLTDGYDIRTMQELLGHKDVRTMMIYTHVLNRG